MIIAKVRMYIGVAFVAAVVGADIWYHAHHAIERTCALEIRGELQLISTMLKENQALVEELHAEPFTEMGLEILPSYLAKIRRDGIAKHANMKQRLDQLDENNTAIVTLIRAYGPQARTPGFINEADRFRGYASAWRDRWNSVMELFMAGGIYAADVPFPSDFPAAVEAEIAAVK